MFVLPDSQEQEGTESDEGQLPQVVEELKDLQVAPGTRLAKFQLRVKGEGQGWDCQLGGWAFGLRWVCRRTHRRQ